MGDYVDKSVQTDIEGLTRDPAARPAALIPRADTNTPPDEMAIDKLNLPAEGTPSITKTLADERNTSPSLLLKRKKRPPMVARISLPASEFDSDNPRSPPPTHAVFSPLPAANTLHAGHTPIIPRALSPLQHNDTSSPATPEQEAALSGPLTLPPQPGDGADDTIPLNVLDAELEKLRIEQEMEEQQNDAFTQESIPGPASAPAHEDEAPLSRITSAEPRRTSEVNEVVDGILLKKQRPINFGAPMGEA